MESDRQQLTVKVLGMGQWIGSSKEFTFIWQEEYLSALLKTLCIFYWLLLWPHCVPCEEFPDLLHSFCSVKAFYLASKAPPRACSRLFLQPRPQSIDLAYFIDLWFREHGALGNIRSYPHVGHHLHRPYFWPCEVQMRRLLRKSFLAHKAA